MSKLKTCTRNMCKLHIIIIILLININQCFPASAPCPPAPYVPNAVLSYITHNVTSVQVALRCASGYRYWDGSKVRIYTCQDDWPYGDLEECIC